MARCRAQGVPSGSVCLRLSGPSLVLTPLGHKTASVAPDITSTSKAGGKVGGKCSPSYFPFHLEEQSS